MKEIVCLNIKENIIIVVQIYMNDASHIYYMVADNIFGPYSEWFVMEGTDEYFSHVTQTGFFYTIKIKEETIPFFGDRWTYFAENV